MAPKITVATTISELAEINTIRDEAFNITYQLNCKRICEYSDTFITAVLSDRTKVVLNPIRETLLTKVVEVLPAYADRQSLNNQDKPIIIRDIIALSRSIICVEPHAECDAVYKDTEPEADLTDLNSVIGYVRQLKKDLNSTKCTLKEVNSNYTIMQNNYEEVKTENKNLWEILRASGLNHSVYPKSDLSDISDASDSGSESDSSEVHPPQSSNKRKKKNVLEGEEIHLEGEPKKAYAFVGNVKSRCTPKEVLKHVKRNSKIKLNISDIQEMDTKSDNKDFKVTVNRSDLQTFISETKWPSYVRVEVFTQPKSKRVTRPQSNGQNRNHGSNQGFRNQNKNDHGRNSYGPSRKPYQPKSGDQYQKNYQPGGHYPRNNQKNSRY